MTVHLPPLFTIMGVGFASIVTGVIVSAILGFIGFLGAFGGRWPEWPLVASIPCGIVAAVVSGYFYWGLT